MEQGIIQLHPDRREYESVRGLYLAENLHAHPRRPLIYANFVSSLDGRIAVTHARGEPAANGRPEARQKAKEQAAENHSPPERGSAGYSPAGGGKYGGWRGRTPADDGHTPHFNLESGLPASLTNPNDLRLFLELLAQADCVITHGAYLRARAAGLLGDILHLDADLDAWRRERGLAPPTVVVCSASLDFPEPDDLERKRVIIATGENHDRDRAEYWRGKDYPLITAGAGAMVEAGALLDHLTARGSATLCFAAGPKLLESALTARRLDLLYLTLSHQLIGGDSFQTLIPSAELGHCRLLQKRLIFDNSPALEHPQWFAKFDCEYR